MSKLRKKLKNLKTIPMHMPGHKRNIERFSGLGEAAGIDITEIDGFDNLHVPSGILKESMKNASELFKSENSIYLVNGSTCGILSAICALIGDGDKVIMDRTSHKSVYNAIELSGAVPVYIKASCHEKYGLGTGLTPDEVKTALVNNPDAKLIIITSPSYEGVISDIEGICNVAKAYGVPVMVDAAHGAHLGFYKFPKSAVSGGADIVIESLHKTLPSLTQTAILHVKDKYYNPVRDMLSVFETSSPSYVLMSSIDECMDIISDESVFSCWYDILTKFREDTKALKNLKILEKDDGFFDYDPSKIVIMTNNPGLLFTKLQEHNIEPEMASTSYIICMTGAGDTAKTLDTLRDALFEIDAFFSPVFKAQSSYSVPKRVLLPKSARRKPSSYVSIQNALGQVAAEYIWAYPPGVPLVVPGEVIDEEVINTISEHEKNGINLSGNSSFCEGKILVINS